MRVEREKLQNEPQNKNPFLTKPQNRKLIPLVVFIKHSCSFFSMPSTTTTTNTIENWKIIITLLSHPQIAYKIIEAGGTEDVLQNKIYI